MGCVGVGVWLWAVGRWLDEWAMGRWGGWVMDVWWLWTVGECGMVGECEGGGVVVGWWRG